MTKITSGSSAVVDIVENLDSLPEPYRNLFQSRQPEADFFTSLPWLRHLAATALEKNHSVRVYCAASGSGRAVLPLRHATPSRSSLWMRKLTALANFYSPIFEPALNQPGDEALQALTFLVRAIAEETPQWDAIDLHPMNLNSPIFNTLDKALRAAGMAMQPYFCFGNWTMQVNGRSYQEYFDGLPSKLQHTVIRKSRQLEQSNRLRIDIVSSKTDLEKSIEAYQEIYGSSWKKPEPFPAFIPGLIRLCAEQGCLRLGVAYLDEQPVAAQLWVVHNHVASIYKLAYNEAFARLSVGSILTSRLMRHVIDVDQVHEVDYLSGDEAYKKDWMSHRRERWGLVAFNLRTARGALLALRHVGMHTFKARLKSLLRR